MAIENLADLFHTITKTGAFIVAPANDMEMERCNRDLKAIGCLPLPKEYKMLLRSANGIAWNGFQFFGTDRATEEGDEYELVDIASYNEEYGFDARILIIGKFDEDYHVYNDIIGKYQVLDRLTKIDVDTYDSLEELIVDTIVVFAS